MKSSPLGEINKLLLESIIEKFYILIILLWEDVLLKYLMELLLKEINKIFEK